MMETKLASTKTYLIERSNETVRVTVPASWKVTFGPVSAGNRGAFSGEEGMCLRFYESANQQRAIFTRVRSFRDTSIPMEKLVIERQNKAEMKAGAKGHKHSEEEVREEKWVTA
jgi:hypothetical protein